METSVLATWQWLTVLGFLVTNTITVAVLYSKAKTAQEKRHAHNARRMDWQLSIMNKMLGKMGLAEVDCPFLQDDY
jgi:hypothetical protein